MFLPIGDSPNPPGRPWITWLLIAANIAVYLVLLPLSFQSPDPHDPAVRAYLQAIASERDVSLRDLQVLAQHLSLYDVFVFRHAFRPAAPSLAGLLASMFLHVGFLHLAGNMLFLWIFGDNVEHRLGRALYLAAYVGTGLCAGLGDALLRIGSALPAVGASGAISGVLGLYFVWFPYNRVRLWLFLFPIFMNVVELPARLVLGCYVVFDNVLPLLFTHGEGGVAHGAHIGGFVAGAAFALLGSRLGARRAWSAGPGTPPPIPCAPAGGPGPSFRQALDDGRWRDAAETFFSEPAARTRASLTPWDKIRLGSALLEQGHDRAALAAFQRALVDHPAGPGRASAHLGAARVLMDRLGNPTGAYQHLYAALEENPDPAEAAEARALLDRLAATMRTVPRRLPT